MLYETLGEMREVSGGFFTDGIRYFAKKSCLNCEDAFFARKDRIETNKFCSKYCYQDNIEKNNTFCLSKNDIDILNGCILSDGSVTKTKKAKNYLFTHTSIYESYSNFIIEELNIPLTKIYCKPRLCTVTEKTYNGKASWQLKSPNSPSLMEWREKWYKEKKVIPRDIELTPICVLHWYLGDGSLDNKTGIHLCTDSFSKEDNEFLSFKLNELDFCTSISKRNRIIIPNKRVFEFLRYIGDCPLECFCHKWDTIVTESYIGRKCRECNVEFDTKTNSKYYCSHKCYMRNWRKKGPTLRIAREN